MDSIDMIQKSHAVCIPYPAQGHINPMLNLAKLLHHWGFHVTFVNTEYNHSPSSLDGLPSFQDLLQRPNKESATSGSPLVSCMVSDGVMTFTLDAVEAIGVLEVLFWTASACSFMGYLQYRSLIDKGLTPLKEGERAKRASAIIFNTFDRLEHEVLNALKAMFPPIYTLGPLHLLTKQLFDNNTRPFRSNLWKEEPGCIEWLNSKGKEMKRKVVVLEPGRGDQQSAVVAQKRLSLYGHCFVIGASIQTIL
ncbi:hypothetical protein EUGRSUZ_L00990 [Eucalyptus grandis]|uniref:Uncharacterized protein n=1 Tax=Eucalyptus grandis TaxID=71139 RepID=A0A058ZU58_EUCGR|nr:hypothetical protein EUGRSUZ_L00990 [Eucalyptus grandis]